MSFLFCLRSNREINKKSNILIVGKVLNLMKVLVMAQPIKYIIDEKGQKTSVLVPITTWTKINEDYTKLQNKLHVLLGIKSALTEIKSAKETGKKLQTLKSFLSESHS